MLSIGRTDCGSYLTKMFKRDFIAAVFLFSDRFLAAIYMDKNIP
jgi:hypothetical protein